MRLFLLFLTALPLAAATDVTGKWTLNGDIVGNPVNLTCSVKQDTAAKVTGKCTGAGGEVDLAGSVKDQILTFSITAGGYELVFTGKVESDSVSGEIAVAGVNGTFSGKREAKE